LPDTQEEHGGDALNGDAAGTRWSPSGDFQDHLASIRGTFERFELLEHVATKR
jgi:hypothetical protein